MDDEWTNRKDEVIKYCLKDADLALRILTHPRINTINKLMDVAIPSKLPVKEVSGGQNRMIESLLIRMVDREDALCPWLAGTVRLRGRLRLRDQGRPLGVGDRPRLFIHVPIPDHQAQHLLYYADEEQGRCGPYIPCRSLFMAKEKRYGIMPRMVEGLLNSRKEAKALMKKAKQDGDKDMQRNTTTACRTPSRYWPTPPTAISAPGSAAGPTAATSRRASPPGPGTRSGPLLIARKPGLMVIAGDTDSVFFNSKDHRDLESCKMIGFQVQQEFSAGNMHLELEKVMERFFAHAKKRYFGKIIWPEPTLLVRGYEPRRTDSFDLQSETMTKVFQIVLEGKPEDAVSSARTRST